MLSGEFLCILIVPLMLPQSFLDGGYTFRVPDNYAETNGIYEGEAIHSLERMISLLDAHDIINV